MSLFKKIVVLMVLSLGCEHKKFLNPYDPINLPPAPELQHPEDNFVSPDNPPFFQWDLKEDTLNPFYGSDIIYEIQISTDSNFFSALFLSMITDYKIYLPSKLFCDSIYYWRVRARYLETDWGEWSKVNKFKVRFPVVGALSIPPHSNDMIIHQNYAFIAYAPG
ncbi:MAG: DUF4962 domain-containing protein, partial [candidate division WOR-3 bacterium]|nr:DUF4962 domain-containing protein [candidate division WOR-3 bacterium]